MVLATITEYIPVKDPSFEMVRLTASDTNTYKSQKFKYVECAIACINVDTDDSISVTNGSDNSALDGTEQTVRLNGSALSSSVVLLMLWGGV